MIIFRSAGGSKEIIGWVRGGVSRSTHRLVFFHCRPWFVGTTLRQFVKVVQVSTLTNWLGGAFFYLGDKEIKQG
jgi:hypothetical protein